MFSIDMSISRANVPKTIRFTEDSDAKLSAHANGENITFSFQNGCKFGFRLDGATVKNAMCGNSSIEVIDFFAILLYNDMVFKYCI